MDDGNRVTVAEGGGAAAMIALVLALAIVVAVTVFSVAGGKQAGPVVEGSVHVHAPVQATEG